MVCVCVCVCVCAMPSFPHQTPWKSVATTVSPALFPAAPRTLPAAGHGGPCHRESIASGHQSHRTAWDHCMSHYKQRGGPIRASFNYLETH